MAAPDPRLDRTTYQCTHVNDVRFCRLCSGLDAGLRERLSTQHRRVESVGPDGDDWTGCLCGEVDDDCVVLAALERKEPCQP